MEKISWANYVRNEEVLHRSEECAIRRRKTNWIGRMFCGNCLLKHVTEGKTDVMGRRARRRKQLVDVLNGKERILEIERGNTGTGFGGGCGSLVRHTIK
jgi:hypothetical protein